MDPTQRWAKAGLADDFIFSKVMVDPQICREVIQRILPDRHIGEITIPKSQQELNSTIDAKGVRFDIYTEDDQHAHYDLEMQVVNHHNVNQRARFYQAAMTNDAVEKGDNYRTADRSYVIFFCMFDPLALGLQQYTIQRHVNEQAGVVIDDGTVNIFFNVLSLRQEVSPKLQRFLDVIAQRPVEDDDDFIVKLREKIKFVKHSKKWRDEYMRMTLNEMDHQYELKEAEKKGQARGIKQGRMQGQKIAKQERENGIQTMVKALYDTGIQPAVIKQQLIDKYQLTPERAEHYLRLV